MERAADPIVEPPAIALVWPRNRKQRVRGGSVRFAPRSSMVLPVAPAFAPNRYSRTRANGSPILPPALRTGDGSAVFASGGSRPYPDRRRHRPRYRKDIFVRLAASFCAATRKHQDSIGYMLSLDHCGGSPDRGRMVLPRINCWTFRARFGAHGAPRSKAMA